MILRIIKKSPKKSLASTILKHRKNLPYRI